MPTAPTSSISSTASTSSTTSLSSPAASSYSISLSATTNSRLRPHIRLSWPPQVLHHTRLLLHIPLRFPPRHLHTRPRSQHDFPVILDTTHIHNLMHNHSIMV